MTGRRLASVRQFAVPQSVVDDTLVVLREFGTHELEGLVLWLGSIDDCRATVVRHLVPPQQPVREEQSLGYFVDGETLFALNQALAQTGLRLLAQVHSHPREAFHSDTDDRYAIVTAEGGLSLVVPDFGDAPADPRQWAAYRVKGGEWLELSTEQVFELFQISGD